MPPDTESPFTTATGDLFACNWHDIERHCRSEVKREKRIARLSNAVRSASHNKTDMRIADMERLTTLAQHTHTLV